MTSRPSKKRKLTPPQSDDEDARPSNGKVQKAFIKNAANWDLEQAWEDRARRGNKKKEKKEKKSNRLPIKLPSGVVQQVSAPADDVASLASDEDWLEGEDGIVEGDGDDADEPAKPVEAEPELPEPEQIRQAKEELAKIASMINEDPEENVGGFKAIARVGQSKIPAIQKLALATQLAVYKDVIPGYRIRPISEMAAPEKLSKEVRKLRAFEQSLVSGYQAYVKSLAVHAKAGRKNNRFAKPIRGQSVASVAISCACNLLTSVPHFNFRGDLVKILVGKLSSRKMDEDSQKCLRAFETLFDEDEEGRPAMEAVSTLSKMMRVREYNVDEGVVNLFLHLRLLTEFAGKGSKDTVERDEGAKKPKAKKEFRTKKLRKQMKEQKEVEKEMAQADALVSHEEKDRMQSETLKLVFATYFRILKARLPHLMGAVLEGLAKYAHLINQDFFGDILEALKDLIRYSDVEEDDAEDEDGQAASDDDDDDDDDTTSVRNTSREALLCTVTAFALLAGQDAHNARADLHLDLSFFTTHLYQTLYPLSLNADLELGARSLHLPDPNNPGFTHGASSGSSNKVNLQTTTVLLIRSLTASLLPHWNMRSVPPLRIAAFAKQLMTTSLHTPEKSTRALLALLSDVGSQHGRKVASLWDTEERKGDGRFLAGSDVPPEASNPYAATVWEGELLRRHYCPQVREGVKTMEKTIQGARR